MKYSAKQNARYIAHRLLKQGKLIRKNACEKCGNSPKPIMRVNGRKQSRIEMHHADYTKPEIVDWLCERCHKEVHGQKLLIAP